MAGPGPDFLGSSGPGEDVPRCPCCGRPMDGPSLWPQTSAPVAPVLGPGAHEAASDERRRLRAWQAVSGAPQALSALLWAWLVVSDLAERGELLDGLGAGIGMTLLGVQLVVVTPLLVSLLARRAALRTRALLAASSLALWSVGAVCTVWFALAGG